MDLQFDKTGHEDMPHFTIKGTIPSMNEFLAANRRSPYVGSKMKRDYEMLISYAIRRGLGKIKVNPPVIIHYLFYEPTMKRDVDNIAFSCVKFVHDTLQKCGVLENDGWKQIPNFTHDYFVDKKNPRIEVYIEEVE